MRKQSKEILEEVKANIARLKTCPGPHDFSIGINLTGKEGGVSPRGNIYSRYQCSICKGEISTSNKLWYTKGLEHAHQDLDKIPWPTKS